MHTEYEPQALSPRLNFCTTQGSSGFQKYHLPHAITLQSGYLMNDLIILQLCVFGKASGTEAACSRCDSKPIGSFCLAAYQNSLATHLNEEAC